MRGPSSKFALEGLSESISYELQPYGIKVILIEPGVIKRNFVPNIIFPSIAEKRSKPAKKGENVSYSYYSQRIDAFLSHYYPSYEERAPPQ